MHISTTILCAILLSILGGSKTVHAYAYEDAFGVTNDGFQCNGRVYPKFVIYATATHYCNNIKRSADLRSQSPEVLGFRNKFYYYFDTTSKINDLLKTSYDVLPIIEDGTLYPLGSVKNSAKIDPGPDRLIIDQNCNIKGAFIDLDHNVDILEPRVMECKVLRSNSVSSFRSPQRSPQNSP